MNISIKHHSEEENYWLHIVIIDNANNLLAQIQGREGGKWYLYGVPDVDEEYDSVDDAAQAVFDSLAKP